MGYGIDGDGAGLRRMVKKDAVGKPAQPENADTVTHRLMRGGIAQDALQCRLYCQHQRFTRSEMLLSVTPPS